ncbi:Zn-dependent protease [bacterium]|nr:MAG: Zn-dependent protease [bacterium]RKZ16213.1 MAG: Zn-dependent protease [bacterium]
MLRALPILIALTVLLIVVAPTRSEATGPSPIRPVSTYSIVALDPDTGQLGVAVQSHWFSVGAMVPWARAGIGAVATQSLVDPSYGPLGLELMAAGKSATQTLEALTTADAHPEIRQVGMVDADGNVAVHTGSNCIPEAGHRTGENYTVQANLMANDTVPDAMAEAFESAEGDLAARMLRALEAAQQAGGDIRGKQSAAILVVSGEVTGRSWQDTVVDLRVEDHAEPLAELGRLLTIHRGYAKMNEGDLAIEEDDLQAAEAAYGAAQEILGDNLEASYWYAVALCNAGEIDRAVEVFHRVFEAGDNWRVLTPRLLDGGFLVADEATLERILGKE